ncbi:MAG: hypothetical protein WA940_00225 [Sphingopyxis sp.]
MTDTTHEPATVEVTQDDRETFRSICLNGDTGANISAMLYRGAWDDDFRMRELARHRTRATRQDGLPHDLFSHRAAWRRALVIVTEAASPPWHDVDDRAYWQHEIDVFDHVFAALSDSRTREESGSDEALKEQEFNRGVLIAVSTLINCWGRGTETEHLLAMINATPEMVEQMGFDNYDREPLLAALSASPEGEGK